VSIGHHGGAAFLAAHRNVDTGVVQAVENGQVTFARHAKNVLDALSDELIDKNVAAQAARLYWQTGFHKPSA
jgi:hypothetical protein